MKTYIHIMSGNSVEASCEVDTETTSHQYELEQLVGEVFGIYYDVGYRIEYVSKSDSEARKNGVIYDILVLDGELDCEKSWNEDAIEESGFEKVELSSHIFDGYSQFAIFNLEDEEAAA